MKLQYYQGQLSADGRGRVIPGKWRWRLVARNGKTLADGADDYVNEGNAKRACRKVQALFKAGGIKIEKSES
jgi:uncharacterized protein YegP (UPF0339 family)